MRVITHGGAHVNGHGRKDSYDCFGHGYNSSLAQYLNKKMELIDVILLCLAVVCGRDMDHREAEK